LISRILSLDESSLLRGNEKTTKACQLVYDDDPHVWIYEGSSIENQKFEPIDGIFFWLVTLDIDPDNLLCFGLILDH
jgi:hypothetical protein